MRMLNLFHYNNHALKIHSNFVFFMLILGSVTEFVATQIIASIRDLNLDMPYFEQQANTWTAYSLSYPTPSSMVTTECGTGPLLGGPGIFSTFPSSPAINKFYDDLLPHTSVFITFEVTLIDEWTSDVSFQAGTKTFYFDYQSFPSSLCGASDNDFATKIWLFETNSDSSYFLQIAENQQGTMLNAQFGIRNINIALSNKTVYDVVGGTIGGCVFFPSSYPSSSYGCPCPLSQYMDTSGSNTCLPCHSSCETCYGGLQTECVNCADGYTYNGESCVGGPSGSNSSFQCTELNTFNSQQGINRNETLYYYPDDSTCKTICPDPYVINSEGNIPLCVLPLSQKDIQDINYLESIGATARTVMTAGVTTITAIGPSNPTALSVATLSRLFEYTRQFDVTRSPRLELYYKTHMTSPGTTKIGSGLSDREIAKFTYHLLPQIFVQNNLHSSFLVNFFQNLETLLIISATTLLLFGIQAIMKRKYLRFLGLFQKVILAAVSFLTTQFYGIYADILFLGTLEFMSFTGGNALAWLSFFFAIIFYFLTFSFLVYHFILIWTYQKIKVQVGTEEGDKKMKEFQIRHKKVEVLYKDFKDHSFIEQAFLLFLTTRAALTGIFMSSLWAYPGVQIVYNILMNILTIIYLSFKTPYKSVPIILQQIVYELDFILVNVCFLIMAVIDVNETPNNNLRSLLGDIVIYAILFSRFVPIITIAPKGVNVMRERIKVLKNQKNFKNDSGITTETPLSPDSKRDTIIPDEVQPMIKEGGVVVELTQRQQNEDSSRTSYENQLPQEKIEPSKLEDIKINMNSVTFSEREDNEFEKGGRSPMIPVYVRESLIYKERETSSLPQTAERGLKLIKSYHNRGEAISRTCLGEQGNEFGNEGMSPITNVDVRENLMK